MCALKKLIAGQLGSIEGDPRFAQIWEAQRSRSLKNWSMDKPGDKEMAEAGFYCPVPDVPGTVKCFACFIELDGWEPTDDPWTEHRKRGLVLDSPCKFAELGKKEENLTVDDFVNVLKSLVLRVVTDECKKKHADALRHRSKMRAVLKKELKKLGID